MEIKRTVELFVETNRRIIIRPSDSAEQFFCPLCDAAMLAAEQIAEVFRLNRRVVYRHIENENVHFAEIETGAVMVCSNSLAAFLEAQRLPGETTGDF